MVKHMGQFEQEIEDHRFSEDLSLSSNFLKLAVHSLKSYSLQMQEQALFSCTAPYTPLPNKLIRRGCTTNTHNCTSVSTDVSQDQLPSAVILCSPCKTEIHVHRKQKQTRNKATESNAGMSLL